jgi:carboxypeptidase family protein
MTDWSTLTLEPMIAASPIWIRVLDTFTGRPPAGPVNVRIERRVGAGWIGFEHRHQVSSTGDLTFVNLGRTRDPVAVGTFDVRVFVDYPGAIAEAAGGGAAITRTITAWAPDAPDVPSLPDDLRLFPGPSYSFPAGTPVLAGQVVDAHGDPVERARVWATATVQNSLLTEEVRSGGDGRFRLSLRWSAGATDVRASHGTQAGSITVSLPADLSSTHQITLT